MAVCPSEALRRSQPSPFKIKVGKPAASIGFAIEVDNLLLALSSQKIISEKEEKPEVIQYGPADRTEAIAKAQKLRAEGHSVALRLKKEAR